MSGTQCLKCLIVKAGGVIERRGREWLQIVNIALPENLTQRGGNVASRKPPASQALQIGEQRVST